MPYYTLHSIYYKYWLYQKAQENKTPEELGAEAVQGAIEDSI